MCDTRKGCRAWTRGTICRGKLIWRRKPSLGSSQKVLTPTPHCLHPATTCHAAVSSPSSLEGAIISVTPSLPFSILQFNQRTRRDIPCHFTQTSVDRLLLAEKNNFLGFHCQECASGLLHGIFSASPFSSLLLLLML